MPIARFQMEDGRIARFEVPEGTTPEQAQSLMQGHFAQPTPKPEQQEQTTSMMQDIGQGIGNVAAGAVRGAGSIGATLLSPFESSEENIARRQAMDVGLQSLGAQPESMMYKGGQIAGEIAGTSGIGGTLAKGVQLVPKIASKLGYGGISSAAEFAPKITSALRAGGFGAGKGLGQVGANIAAGAATGGASAGLTGGDVGTGALIGGALPAGISGIKTAAPAILGMTTGAGSESIRQAFQAGTKGGTTAKAFTENLRGKVPVAQVLDDVNANIAEIGRQRAAQYQANMQAVGASAKPLSYKGIDKAVDDALSASVTSKGFIKNKAAASVQKEISDVVEEAKARGMNTAEDFDALKQRIGAIRESIPMNERTAQKIAGDVYNSIKGEIIRQEPQYANAMRDYSEASELLGEIRQTLSNKPNASIDTQMRKLQSLMRNNVNTSYGNRLDLVRQMEAQGGREIAPAVAGQALSSYTPRGLQSASTIPASMIGYGAGGLPLAGLGLLSASPRLVGEASYGVGRLADLGGRIPFSAEALQAARQAGIIETSR